MKRYYVYDFVIGSPILIDTKEKTITQYSRNIYNQIYNLDQEPTKISRQRISGLIRKTNGRNYYRNELVIDRYIYHLLMTEEERERCGRSFYLNENEFITSGDDKREVLEEMCLWALDYDRPAIKLNEKQRAYYKSCLENIA